MQRFKIPSNVNIFFTGCTHYGHKNISGASNSTWNEGWREFTSVAEMDYELLNGINNVVKEDDILFHLGDFSFGGHKYIPTYRNLIKCKNVHLISGNHDDQHIHKYKDSFSSISDMMELSYKGENIIISHYPQLVWKGNGLGWWHLHSHCHNHKNIIYMNTKCKRFEPSMDSAKFLLGEYRPFSFNEIKEIQDKKPIQILDGHNKNTNVI